MVLSSKFACCFFEGKHIRVRRTSRSTMRMSGDASGREKVGGEDRGLYKDGGVFDLSVRMGEYILDMGTMLAQKHVERIRNITLALSAIT